jgi:uncharacterized membrane protein
LSATDDARRRFLCIALIVAGIFFRIYHAGFKLYNPDEANTSIRVSGHTNADVGAFLHDGRVHRVRDLAVFAAPTAQTQPADIVHSLATEDPQHPPLFFLAMFVSERATGDALFWRRFPAVVFGILSIGAAWWFGRELFGEPSPAWIFAALVAVSPFHVAFAQEAREYSLYLLLSFVTSALLFSALRTGHIARYVAYAIAVSLAFWSFTLFAIVAAAHAAYLVLPVSGAPWQRRLFALVALALGTLSFAPWLANLFHQAGRAAEDMSWQASALSAPLYAGKFLFNFGSVFFDLDYLWLVLAPIAFVCIAIALCASSVFLRRMPLRIWFFPLAIAALTVLAFIVPDLVRHETRALQNRYLLSLWVAVEVAVAGGVWAALRDVRGTRRTAWNAALGVLFAGGVASCAVASMARTWWITGPPDLRALPAISDRLALLPEPTIVYMEDGYQILMLEPYANDALRFDLHAQPDAAALHGAPHPYAILTSEQEARLPLAPDLVRVPVDETFEMRPDPALDAFRRRGAAGRKEIDRLDLGLYTTAR